MPYYSICRVLGVLATALVLPVSLPAADSPVSVRMMILQEKFCLGKPAGPVIRERQPPDAITLRLKIRLSYHNQGPEPLIVPLSRASSAIVSRNMADVISRKNQFVIKYRPAPPPAQLVERGINLDRPQSPFFEIIPSGGENREYQNEHVILRIHAPSKPNAATELLGRQIYLQLQLNHGQLSSALARDLANRWQAIGRLLTDEVRTEPIQITIPMVPKIGDCSSEYTID